MEDRSKRAETVRPQMHEHCEKRRECDGTLNVTNDKNGDELNGETDDEDMEDGEVGFDDGSARVRNIRDPGQPTAKEHQDMTTHRPHRSRCKFCDGARCERAAQEMQCSRRLEGSAACVNGLCGEKEPEDRESFGLFRAKERSSPGSRREQRSSSINSGSTESRSGATTSRQLKHWRERLHKPAQEGSQTVPERPPVGESQLNGIIERVVGLVFWSGQNTEGCTGAPHWGQSPPDARMLCCGILDEQVRHRQGRKDTAAKTTRAKGQYTDLGVWRKDPVHARQTSERRKVGAAVPPRSVCWHAELVVRGSGCHRAGTGDQDKVGEHQLTAYS